MFSQKCRCGRRYIFGEEVNGVAYVVFGVVQDGTKRSFPGSLKRVQVSCYIHFCQLIGNSMPQSLQDS